MSKHPPIPEEFIHYIWENRLFYDENLRTMTGEPVEVIHPGCRNTDSGPDFFQAKVKISGILWVGNVEMHRKASDWEKHHHHTDNAYSNVILHVVKHADRQICRKDGSEIAAVELKWPRHYTRNYRKLLKAKTWIACQDQFFHVDPLILHVGFNRLMIERLERKTNELISCLEENHYNWNEAFYLMLARMFGLKVNAAPFELLARSVPLRILEKHKNSLFQLEALLFGTSGLLSGEFPGDVYFMKLQQEFLFLQKKYNLRMVQPHLWKFLRLRPVNFPTLRIAQLAALIRQDWGLFSMVMDAADIQELKKLFRVKASDYWNNHYRFNKPTNHCTTKELGEYAVDMLIVNVVVPFLFVYGESQSRPLLKNRALDFLEKLPAENNAVIRKWRKLGVEAGSAFESQALLQLKNRYCNLKDCLHCPVGNQIVRKGSNR